MTDRNTEKSGSYTKGRPIKENVSRLLRKTLFQIPIARNFHKKIKTLKTSRAAKATFVNHQAFLDALSKKEEGLLTLKTHDGLNITIRKNLYDALIVQEIFFHKPYLRKIRLSKNPTIVDIGGYIGDFDLYAAKYLGAKKIVVYEPSPENFSVLIKNIEDNGFHDTITAVNKAVSNSSEVELNFYIKEHQEIHVSKYFYNNCDRRTIPSVTLAEIIEDHKLENIDLLKIDCEGGEYDIIPSLTNYELGRTKNIVFEHHRVNDYEKKVDAIIRQLRGAGYSVSIRRSIISATKQ